MCKIGYGVPGCPKKARFPLLVNQDGTLCCSSISNRAIRPSIEAVISARHLWPSSPQKDMYQTCVKIKICVWCNLPMSDAAANMRTSQLQCMCICRMFSDQIGWISKGTPGWSSLERSSTWLPGFPFPVPQDAEGNNGSQQYKSQHYSEPNCTRLGRSRITWPRGCTNTKP